MTGTRADQRDTALEVVGADNPDAVVCVGPPFGHALPQWILPYGGTVTVDGAQQRIGAAFGSGHSKNTHGVAE